MVTMTVDLKGIINVRVRNTRISPEVSLFHRTINHTPFRMLPLKALMPDDGPGG